MPRNRVAPASSCAGAALIAAGRQIQCRNRRIGESKAAWNWRVTRSIASSARVTPLLTHASRRALDVRVAHRKHRKEEYSHEGLVSHRSAVRSRDLRNDPDLSASNATWSRTERRWSEGHHLWARPSGPAAGGKTRVSTRATGCPSRLLILFERQRRYSPRQLPLPVLRRLLEGLPSVAREPISAAGSIRPNGGRLLSSPITGNERWLARVP
jgi:hypothetical protein